MDFGTVQEGKMRLVQEMVPGKQVTLAHIIASPDEIIYQKLGLNPNVDYQQAAIGNFRNRGRYCDQDLQGGDGVY